MVRLGSSKERFVTHGRGFLLASLHVSQPSTTGCILIIRPGCWGRENKWESENVSVPRSLKITLFQILMHESLFSSIKAGSIVNQESLLCSAAFSGDADRQ